MDPAIVKIVLTGLVAVSYWYSLTPPNYPSSKDKVLVDGSFGTIAHSLSSLSKISVLIFLLAQMATIALAQYTFDLPSTISVSSICPHQDTASNSIHRVTLYFLLTSLIAISMGVVRAWCFGSLGDLFTFQITTHKSHHLVTAGPYAYVRHPAYTALIILIICINILVIDPEGWVMQCGIMQTPLGWVFCCYFGLCVFSIISMLRRGKIEDEQLRGIFGQEWAAYSKRVGFRFFPGIL